MGPAEIIASLPEDKVALIAELVEALDLEIG